MFYSWAEQIVNKAEKERIYWWQPKDERPNIGDYVAYDLVNRILAMKGKRIIDKRSADNKLVSVGSVLHFANTGDTLWGTGLNKKINDEKNQFSDLDVRAVRGPLTREYLENRGIAVPGVYGDPAILLPEFYPAALMETPASKEDFIIINHMNDDMTKYGGFSRQLVSPMQYPGSFIEKIVNSRLVISSSLHGVIIAEAYGVPAIFFDSGSGESMFKYEDYYQGTKRNTIPRATSIEQALSMPIPPVPALREQALALYEVFPFDLWQ